MMPRIAHRLFVAAVAPRTILLPATFAAAAGSLPK